VEVAEAFHVWDFCEEELATRGWDKYQLAARMSGDFATNVLMIDLIEHARNEQMLNVVIRGKTADLLAEGFGVSAELFIGLDESWKTWIKSKSLESGSD
jgi:plasmid maintenance system antidote protein VapI